MPDAPTPRIGVRIAAGERGSVATVTIDNQEKLNTLNSALMREFIAQVGALAGCADLRVVVLTGAGERAFIGGASIDEMATFDHASARQFITLLHRCCAALRDLPVPVIARIDGYALGGGLEVAVACDLRVATTRASFGMPEVKVGLPSVIEAALIPRLIGWGRAREFLYTGEMIDAETALRWGLIERMVPPDQLDREVDKLVGSLLAAGPNAVRAQKALMRQWESLSLDRAIEAGIEALVRSCDTDEPKRLMKAFLNRKR